MLELLSPAGSPEAVIAAVQNGADSVYMGFGDFNARRGAKNFSPQELEKAIRYCRIRGCKTYVCLNTLISDRETAAALNYAGLAADMGATGFIVQDLGLVSILKRSLPSMPVHASTQMSIHNLAGAKAAAEMGCSRVVLARELSLEQIRYITQNAGVETEIFVHGALCFCHSGQCYMSACIGRRSGNRGMCAQPCRMQYSLGGRMDEYPLSLKDNCLVQSLDAIDQAGVACIKIEGRMKRPEYTAIVTGVYSDAIKKGITPGAADMQRLESAFSRQGFTDGYFTGSKEDMFGVRAENDSGNEKLYSDARKKYSDSEVRRVGINFYTVCKKGEKIAAAASDEDGNKAVAYGIMPEAARSTGITAEYLRDQMQKTGGTPYECIENKAITDPDLFLPASSINELRRDLIAKITKLRAEAPPVEHYPKPPLPAGRKVQGAPKWIIQVTDPEQLTEELAAERPDYIYFPAMRLISQPQRLKPFTDNGCVPVAVLPRVITDTEEQDVRAVLEQLKKAGIEEVLAGNLGHVMMARDLGLAVRGDFGLNVFNSYSLDILRNAGLISVTASFELRIAQIKDMLKSIDTEIITYGRLPVMVSDQCIIRQSAGKCACGKPGSLSDRTGNVFPVVKEFGCRNVIFNAHKLYMADKQEDIKAAGVWGTRLLFTTESPRETVEVFRCYKGTSDYKPNVLTRGLYYRGVD